MAGFPLLAKCGGDSDSAGRGAQQAMFAADDEGSAIGATHSVTGISALNCAPWQGENRDALSGS
jgi:hypothetical protein